MKLARMLVSAFKGVETLTLVPAGKHVIAKGKNGAGKTSLAEALIWALTGEAKSPVRNGADAAKVQVDFGKFTATRSKTAEGKTSIVVKRLDGQPMEGGAAAFLKQVVGPGIGLAPMHLFQMKDEEQVESILRAIGVDVATSKAEEDRLFETRADVNREAKQKAAERATLVAQGADGPAPARVDSNALVAQGRALRARVEAEQKRTHSILDTEAAVKSRKLELATAQANLVAAENNLAKAASVPIDLTAQSELEAVDIALSGASSRNAAADRHDAYVQATVRVTQLEERSKELTNHLERTKRDRSELISAAAKSVGVDGLAIAEDGSALTMHGVRLAELSRAEKMVFAARLVAGTKPDLQILVADGAESLDGAHLQEVMDLAHDLDLQLILTQVTDDNVLEIQIRDGEETS